MKDDTGIIIIRIQF